MTLHKILLLLAVVAVGATPALAQGRKITRPVSDWAGVINASTEERLDRYLWELKQKTGAELAVATIDTTGGIPIERYALQLAVRSGLGKKGIDDGCLVLVAVKDRQYRIEVGYGLEGVLPDGYVGGIGRDYFAPHFRSGNYGRGIEQGVQAIVNKIAVGKGVTLTAIPKPKPKTKQYHSRTSTSNNFLYAITWALFIIFLIVLVVFLTVLMVILDEDSRYGHSSSSWSSGGFSGGSFGWKIASTAGLYIDRVRLLQFDRPISVIEEGSPTGILIRT